MKFVEIHNMNFIKGSFELHNYEMSIKRLDERTVQFTIVNLRESHSQKKLTKVGDLNEQI